MRLRLWCNGCLYLLHVFDVSMLWTKTHVCASVLPRISAIVVLGLSHDSLIDCMCDVLVLHGETISKFAAGAAHSVVFMLFVRMILIS